MEKNEMNDIIYDIVCKRCESKNIKLIDIYIKETDKIDSIFYCNKCKMVVTVKETDIKLKKRTVKAFRKKWEKVGYEKENWDSNHAKGVPISEKLINYAADIYIILQRSIRKKIDKILPIPFIGPYDDENEIVIEWNGKDWNLSIIISEANDVSINIVSPKIYKEFHHKGEIIDPKIIENIEKLEGCLTIGKMV